MVDNVTVNELKSFVDQGEDIQIIDVRELSEYQYVRIANSKLVSLSSFQENTKMIDKNVKNYFLCGVGKRALKAAEYLESLGYKDLYVINGGIKAWLEAGYPVESGS